MKKAVPTRLLSGQRPWPSAAALSRMGHELATIVARRFEHSRRFFSLTPVRGSRHSMEPPRPASQNHERWRLAVPKGPVAEGVQGLLAGADWVAEFGADPVELLDPGRIAFRRHPPSIEPQPAVGPG